MADKIILSLAVHNHQPVGNFGWVFQEAFEKAYLPMLECLERHPRIRLALHYTGPLRDWLLENQPRFLPRLRRLVEAGQIEMMTGSYYEAVLTALPDADKIGQIRKLTSLVKDDFGYDATGLWLAERIWEPHMPRSLSEAGIEYTIVDDAHFKAVGYRDEDLFGYYVTEEQGSILKILATSMWLRYGVPWKPVDAVIRWLREQTASDDSAGRYIGRQKIAVMGDDGEKFGLWPGTYEYVWQTGWMDHFFASLEENSNFIQTIPPGDVVRQYPSLGRIYLPTASYDEMGEWAMPPDAAWELPHLKHELQREGRPEISHYMRGGLWRNFMVKYPEVNQLHKKSLWVSKKVHAMPQGGDKNTALDYLWAGQCNCGYWHGVFGGIYLFHIREADYRLLIRAENLADGLLSKLGKTHLARAEQVDFDLDALDDLVLTTDRQVMVFDPDQGGSLVEWDYRPLEYNLLNVLTRRREGYHQDLLAAAASGTVVIPGSEQQGQTPDTIHSTVVRAREPGLHQKLIYDWHRRATFLDHFLSSDTTLDAFYHAQYGETGDFVNQPYEIELADSTGRRRALAATLRRQGHVWHNEVSLPVTVEKYISVQSGEDLLTVTYRITNGETGGLQTRFGVEMSWGFAGGNDPHTFLNIGYARYSLAELAENGDVSEMSLASQLWHIRVDLDIERPATLWRFPLETISASEGGFERNYQGTTMLLWWPLSLAAGEAWKMELKFNLSHVQSG